MESYVDVVTALWTTIVVKLPSILLALLVLFVGWIVARVVSRAVGQVVGRLTSDATVHDLVDQGGRAQIDRWTARVAFYIVMLFVLIQFFEILGATALTGPFISVANELALAVPNAVKAVLILLTAWVVAALARNVVVKALSFQVVRGLLDRLKVVEGEVGHAALVKSASTIIYYFVLILFLPAVFGALNLEGLQNPVEQVIAQALGFLPRLVAAALTVFIGYWAARIARGVASAFLASSGVDRLPEKVGMEQVFRATPLSQVLGAILFFLIFVPVLISGLDSLGVEAISGPAISMLTIVMNMIPNVAVAFVIFAAGLALARWVGRFVATFLESVNAAGFLVKWGLLRNEASAPVVHRVVGNVVTAISLALVLIEVFNILHLRGLSLLLVGILMYLPHLVLGIAILAAGVAVAGFVRGTLASLLAETSYPTWLGAVAQYAIILLAAVMALEQLGVARAIVVNAFSIVLGSLGLGAAIAIGLGGKETVQRWLESRVYPKENGKERQQTQ